MGEFVGIDPRGAHELIRRMEAGKQALTRTRSGLDAAIAEAGEDWAGRQGTAAMHRTWAFYDEAQQDMKWRIDTIEQLVPVREKGMLTGTFPFPSEAEAMAAAVHDANELADTFQNHDRYLPGRVETAAGPLKDRARDPAYAAALLAELGGPEAFVKVFRDWINTQAPGQYRGLPPASLEQAAASTPGQLAAAFASAERTGRLGSEWYEMVATAPADVLTTLVALAGQSGTFLNRVAIDLLNRPPESVPTAPDWNLYNLAQAYTTNPDAFQQLLAEHPKESGVLLAADTGNPAYPAALADALHNALKPGTGAEGLRERAWFTVIRSNTDLPGIEALKTGSSSP
ncbi:hypothetical protein ACQEVF_03925 [Nonomuraea polychroma]|uniref:hypothetical protein n=1 Tax=Nonomuraea polychroma TaxID=46176 RepID=UPI003D8F3230